MKKYLTLKNIIIAGLVIIVLLQRMGSGCNPFPHNIIKSDTTIKHDTAWLAGKIVEIPKYIPVKSSTKEPSKPIPPASTDYNELVNEYNDLAEKHYQSNFYKDSIKLKDSTFLNKDLGSVYITDEVSENELKGREIKYKLNFPVITNTVTITNTIQAKAKGQLYAGVGITGNKYDIINGGQVGLMYKTKKDHIYQINAGLQNQPNSSNLIPQFGVSTYWKIKL